MRLWLPLCQSPLRHPGGCCLGPSAALTWHGVGRRVLSLHLASRLADPLATCVRSYSGAGAPSQGSADVCPRVPNLAAMCGASKPALGNGGARVGGTLTRPAPSRGCHWAAPIPLLAQSFRRADAAVLRHCGTLLRKPLESSPQHFLAAPGSARLRRGVLVLWPEHSVRGPTVRVGPKQGGWLQGRILTGTSQGALNTILVDLFVQYVASAGLLSSSSAHATSCFWNHSPLGLRFHFRAASCAGPGTNPCAATLASIGSGMLFWPRRHMFLSYFQVPNASRPLSPVESALLPPPPSSPTVNGACHLHCCCFSL